MTRYLAALCILLTLPRHLIAGGLQPYEGFLQSPDLSLGDPGGNTHNLAHYRGQVVLVNFWASWCAPCILEMPAMQRLKDRMSGRPFTILAVNVRESPGMVWKFLSRVKVNFTLLLDSDGQATRDWEVRGYPTSFLVDGKGDIRYIARGALEWDAPDIVRIIEAMLEENNRPQERIYSRYWIDNDDRSRLKPLLQTGIGSVLPGDIAEVG